MAAWLWTALTFGLETPSSGKSVVYASKIENARANKAGEFMPLMGFGGCPVSLHPMHVTLYDADFFGEITQGFEIRVNRAGAVKRTESVQAVAQAFEQMMKLRFADELPVGPEERGRQE